MPILHEDCERPACDDIKKHLPSSREELEAMMKAQQERKNKKNNTTATVECPPRSAELGHGTWNLLHSMGAWYPESPTPQESQTMTNFIKGLAEFYPCTWCAADFQENLQKSPVT